jgi:heat shock protein HtpX
MEMCVDNPREGFADLFATHPSIESRVEALVNNAGGQDPGPLALEEPEDTTSADNNSQAQDETVAAEADNQTAPAKPAPRPGPWNPTEVLTRGPWGGGAEGQGR